MTYTETLEYLYTRLPMYQRVGKVAFKKDLTNTLQLLDHLDNPHEKFKSVHIAGTNGKGSSAHGIAAILQTAGYKTGLYTSPHLKNFTERIRINGQEVPQDFVIDFVDRIKTKIEEIEPSFFEITVAMAFDYFAYEKVDIAIVETGLGGRLDSTNVITPEVSLITNIGYDHMDMLGDTLELIAGEKAGIIKPNTPVVIGTKQEETLPVFQEVAEKLAAPLHLSDNADPYSNNFKANYLSKNFSGIMSVIEILKKQNWKITSEDISKGIDQMNSLTGFKGRFQVISENPLTIADVSHNEDGLQLLFEQINDMCEGTIRLIFGTVKDKELKPIFKTFPDKAKIYWTESQVPRSLPVEELAIAGVMNKLEGECFKDVNEAIQQAKGEAESSDLIIITGSTFVIAEVNDL